MLIYTNWIEIDLWIWFKYKFKDWIEIDLGIWLKYMSRGKFLRINKYIYDQITETGLTGF